MPGRGLARPQTSNISATPQVAPRSALDDVKSDHHSSSADVMDARAQAALDRRRQREAKRLRPYEVKTCPFIDCQDGCDQRGVTGKSVQLGTNLIPMSTTLAEDSNGHGYSIIPVKVKFTPRISDIRQRRLIIKEVLLSHGRKQDTKLKGPELDAAIGAWTYDGERLYLPNTTLSFLTFESEEGNELYTDDEKICVEFTREFKPMSIKAKTVMIIHDLFKRHMALIGYEEMGDIFWNPNSVTQSKAHKDLLQAEAFHLRPHITSGGLTMNVLLKTKHICKLSMYELISKNGGKDSTSREKYVRDNFANRYCCTKSTGMDCALGKRFFRIKRFQQDMGIDSEIEINVKGESRRVTFKSYFNEKGVRLKDNDFIIEVMPLKGAKRMIMIPSDLLVLLSPSPEMKNDQRTFREILAQGQRDADSHFKSTAQFIRDYFNQTTKTITECEAWGLEVCPDDDVVHTQGRILEPAKIKAGRSVHVDSMTGDFTKGLRSMHMYDTARDKLNRVLFIVTSKQLSEVQPFIGHFKTVCDVAGMFITAEVREAAPYDYPKVIEKEMKKNPLDLVFAIVPDEKQDRYDSIKNMCITQFEVPSQCAKFRTVRDPKKSMTVATKIAFQVNAKVGGTPWIVDMNKESFRNRKMEVVEKSRAVVMGLGSLIHSGAQTNSIVTSVDKDISQWSTSFAGPFEQNTAAIHRETERAFTQATKSYMKNVGRSPELVYLYIATENENDLLDFKRNRFSHIVDVLEKGFDNERLKLVVIAATKNHSLRFGVRRMKAQFDKVANTTPGTVADDVGNPLRIDFYLQSASGKLGTINTPTYYNVIHDDFGVCIDSLERLSYDLCNLYPNWTGPVSVPMPLQLGVKAARFFAEHCDQGSRDFLKSDNSCNFRKNMFYL